jgi:uncharacterized membrane protein YgdD (TMEM256/DUF423 family)
MTNPGFWPGFFVGYLYTDSRAFPCTGLGFNKFILLSRSVAPIMAQVFLAIAAALGGLSVALGAFGSHALRERLSDRALDIFETANRYQMYHALALLGVAIVLARTDSPQPLFIASAVAFIVGVVIFSGSLYALSLTGIKWLGAIAPLGGLALIIGWGCLAIAALKTL